MNYIPLDAALIKKYIKNREHKKQAVIEVFTTLPSTNDYLKTKKETPLFCLAEQQSAGKGRLGKTWFSPFGVNIYLSCRWHLRNDIAGLSLVVGLAVIKALTQYGIEHELKIKWPNDILWREKKLAGILIETSAQSPSISQVIIGIGLNVNMPLQADTPINQAWTSLNKILRRQHDRNKITGLLINQLFYYLTRFEQNGLKKFMRQWQKYDCLYGKNISLENQPKPIMGIAAGVNEHGNLLLRHDDNVIRAYSAGNISIKKEKFSP